MEDEIVQPNYALKVIPVGAKFKRGPDRLKVLGFDPLANLVNVYGKLTQEIEYWEKIRDGHLVQVTNTGKTRSYNAEAHMSCFEKLINVNKELMRYGYARVPEGSDPHRPPAPPLVINLTKEGETFTINAHRVIEHD